MVPLSRRRVRRSGANPLGGFIVFLKKESVWVATLNTTYQKENFCSTRTFWGHG